MQEDRLAAFAQGARVGTFCFGGNEHDADASNLDLGPDLLRQVNAGHVGQVQGANDGAGRIGLCRTERFLPRGDDGHLVDFLILQIPAYDAGLRSRWLDEQDLQQSLVVGRAGRLQVHRLGVISSGRRRLCPRSCLS